jgi:hypothetical protein
LNGSSVSLCRVVSCRVGPSCHDAVRPCCRRLGPCRSSRICGLSCTKRRTAAPRRSSAPTRRRCNKLTLARSVTPRTHWFTLHKTRHLFFLPSWSYYVCAPALLSCMRRILEGTKGYICDAVVAVIDHLGTVSSKLEHKLQERTEVAQTERKINFLKQVIFGPELHSSLSLRFYQEISIDICMRQGYFFHSYSQ